MSNFNAVLDCKFESESSEPVTLEEVKLWLRIDSDLTEDDTLLTALITAARVQCENATGVSFVPKTVTAIVNNSCGNIFLPYCPLIHGSSEDITLTDIDGNAVENQIGGNDYPFIISPVSTYLKAVYSAGYEYLPEDLKTALKMQIGYLYENRGDLNDKASISPVAKTILNQYDRRIT